MKLRPSTIEQVRAVHDALDYLRKARDQLTFAEAPQAAGKVRDALKSTEGALRHIQRRHDATTS
jgi:hypothetical protein